MVSTIAKKGRKRKHRWETAKGKVVAVRFTDEQYELLVSDAEKSSLSPGLHLKKLACVTPEDLAME